MSSLGINLAIFLRGVVCRGGGGCGGREGGGIVIFCTNYRVGNIYRLADRLITVRLDVGWNSRETFDH